MASAARMAPASPPSNTATVCGIAQTARTSSSAVSPLRAPGAHAVVCEHIPAQYLLWPAVNRADPERWARTLGGRSWPGASVQVKGNRPSRWWVMVAAP